MAHLLMVVILFLIFTFLGCVSPEFHPGINGEPIMNFRSNFSSSEIFYAVVFDAGSTGTRVHIYKFQKDKEHHVKLVDETFAQVKPGLSDYSENPPKVADSLKTLITSATEVVPTDVQPQTPIVLMATAGLRLLPTGVADDLLQEVSSLFARTEFSYQEEDAVQILDGQNEGIYSWVTVNYLEGGFSESKKSVAALDMGGGSTQVTFVPSDKETVETTPKDFFQSFQLFGQNITLYTHSYLGLGLMSARLRIMGINESNMTSQAVLFSPCLPPDYEFSWRHHSGRKFGLKGLPEEEVDYYECYKIIKPLVQSAIKPVPELKKHKIFAFSYFFDIPVDNGLINKDTGAVLTVGDYEMAAHKACDNPDENQPFMCMDLTYFYSLLKDGYQLDLNKSLHIVNQINKIELSWTLGAAFQILSSMGYLS